MKKLGNVSTNILAMAKTLKIFLLFIVFLVYGLWSTVCGLRSVAYADVLSSNNVRVAIIQDASSLRLKTVGACEVVDFKSNKILYRAKKLNTTVTAYKNSILIGNSAVASANIIIKAGNNSEITIDDRKFRGNIQLVRQPNMRLLVINLIGLEDYVQGILYHEVSHYWPIEVLKAQAIVCRSYALYQKEQMIGKDYDLTSDTYSQVYGGKTSERYRINKAVDETKGVILKYNSKILPAFFHAACGGHTEDGAVLWNINIGPLKGVVCKYCQGSPHYNWHYVISLKELQAKLTEGGYKISVIKNIAILDRNASARVSNLKITGASKDLNISAKDFRNIVGSNVIRSTNFNVAIFADDVVFEGLGWGHGVGLCQWGAYFMAKTGFAYQDILKVYYPGAQLTSLNN
ncbi:MAG: SpoIID/LytB domain-containing protein [Candidatus Omnitrophota bacterium]